MTAAPCDLIGFCHDFERRIAKHRDLCEPYLLSDMRDAACRGDARRVANFMREIERVIRRERLWHLESLATAHAPLSALHDKRRQRFHDLAHGL